MLYQLCERAISAIIDYDSVEPGQRERASAVLEHLEGEIRGQGVTPGMNVGLPAARYSDPYMTVTWVAGQILEICKRLDLTSRDRKDLEIQKEEGAIFLGSSNPKEKETLGCLMGLSTLISALHLNPQEIE